MRREVTGQYEVTHCREEQVRAFVPNPLPPKPPLALGGSLLLALDSASLALGRLDSITILLPNPALFLYFYIRKEAVLSSQIEGTQSSLSDLLLFEMEEAPGVPLGDVVEVSNYVMALQHGLRRLRGEDFPLSNRLLREIHSVLLARGRGSDKTPGEFRTSQNWIGGTRPGNANYVPPPHTAVQDCMAALERFLHARDDSLPILIRAALAHVQFETIHPFQDGNGRVGRLLITLLLCEAGMLKEPLLYLSLYLRQHREEYYDLLQQVRLTGDWEAWIAFFLEGVRETAESAVTTARQLVEMFASDRATIEQGNNRVNSTLHVHEALKDRMILSISEASERTGVAFPTASKAIEQMVKLGIVREITGRRRNRLFAYDRYLAILNEGSEPL